MGRKLSREQAFKIVFQIPFQEDFNLEECRTIYMMSLKDVTNEDKQFIVKLTDGVLFNLLEIDGIISKNLVGWEIERISKIDLAVMRIAVYELCFEKELKTEISVSEALRFIEVYGEEKSKNFVNGILANVSKEFRQSV